MSQNHRITVMTYNVHGCLGLDRRRSPDRIARVIGGIKPDVVALQEIDMRMARSGKVDQAQRIAGLLGMKSHFYATVEDGGGLYGGAVLSRFPLRKVKTNLLPAVGPFEPRGALWVEVDCGGRPMQVVNTHLGLRRQERARQVQTLLSQGWCRHPRFRGPAVLCGDFNMTRRAKPYRAIAELMPDARSRAPRSGRRGTWLGIAHLDHIFTTPDVTVHAVDVSVTPKSGLASDHFPLYAQLSV